jgi:hypothetical protein
MYRTWRHPIFLTVTFVNPENTPRWLSWLYSRIEASFEFTPPEGAESLRDIDITTPEGFTKLADVSDISPPESEMVTVPDFVALGGESQLTKENADASSDPKHYGDYDLREKYLQIAAEAGIDLKFNLLLDDDEILTHGMGGWPQAQDPPPGTKVVRGTTVNLVAIGKTYRGGGTGSGTGPDAGSTVSLNTVAGERMWVYVLALTGTEEEARSQAAAHAEHYSVVYDGTSLDEATEMFIVDVSSHYAGLEAGKWVVLGEWLCAASRQELEAWFVEEIARLSWDSAYAAEVVKTCQDAGPSF